MTPQTNPLTKFEKEIEESLRRQEYSEDNNLPKTITDFESAAENYLQLKKSKRITLRVNSQDLIKVKTKAKNCQIPYQRLISALLHQYAEGKTTITL